MEERQYRYNLIPFVEIRRFWVYRKQLGLMAVVTNLFGNVISSIWIYTAGYSGQNEKRMADRTGRIWA